MWASVTIGVSVVLGASVSVGRGVSEGTGVPVSAGSGVAVCSSVCVADGGSVAEGAGGSVCVTLLVSILAFDAVEEALAAAVFTGGLVTPELSAPGFEVEVA